MSSPTSHEFSIAAALHPEATHAIRPDWDDGPSVSPVHTRPPTPELSDLMTEPERYTEAIKSVISVSNIGARSIKSLSMASASITFYKDDDLPPIILDHGSSLLRNVSEETIVKWCEPGLGQKLFAQVFGFNPKPLVRNQDSYEILVQTVIQDIRFVLRQAFGFEHVTVHAPQPTIEAIEHRQLPATVLISGLSTAELSRVLKHTVISCPGTATIAVHKFQPTIPSRAAICLGGFSKDTTKQEVQRLVRTAWMSDLARDSFEPILASLVPLYLAPLDIVYDHWIDSIDVVRYEDKKGCTFSVLCDPPTFDASDLALFRIIAGSLKYSFNDPWDRTGHIIPYVYCTYCHGRDHRRSACKYNNFPGWTGPRFYNTNSRVFNPLPMKGHPRFKMLSTK